MASLRVVWFGSAEISSFLIINYYQFSKGRYDSVIYISSFWLFTKVATTRPLFEEYPLCLGSTPHRPRYLRSSTVMQNCLRTLVSGEHTFAIFSGSEFLSRLSGALSQMTAIQKSMKSFYLVSRISRTILARTEGRES